MGELLVRPLRGAEIDAYFRMSAPADRAHDWQRETLSAPWHRPEQIRGAFRGGELLGGCIVHERWLRIGRARLLTGCIGDVFVHPAHRKQGVASTLMHEAIAFAEENRHALLLLDGITGFYGRFGYADVFDPSVHRVRREAVLGLPDSHYTVRLAAKEDAEPLLDLYTRHFGTFDRTLEEQRWRLPHGFVAADPGGRVRGFMLPPRGERRARVGEIAADDWPAALALLHEHAGLSEADELGWSIPPTAPLLGWLLDRLHVRTTIRHELDGGWMARPAHLPTLLDTLDPIRHGRSPSDPASTRLVLDVDLTGGAVATGDGESLIGPNEDGAAPRVRLTGRDCVQLLFGFRPAAQLAGVPAAALPALELLFPSGGVWIPDSDSF